MKRGSHFVLPKGHKKFFEILSCHIPIKAEIVEDCYYGILKAILDELEKTGVAYLPKLGTFRIVHYFRRNAPNILIYKHLAMDPSAERFNRTYEHIMLKFTPCQDLKRYIKKSGMKPKD